MINTMQLRELDLLADLKEEHLTVLVKNLRPLSLEAGEFLITEGVTTRAPLLLIQNGRVEISQNDGQGKSQVLTVLDPPTVIGELEFLADVQSSASVRALDSIQGYLLPRERFESLFNQGEAAAYHLALQIGRLASQRLADTNRLLTRALSKALGSPEKVAQVQRATMQKDAISQLDAELESLLR